MQTGVINAACYTDLQVHTFSPVGLPNMTNVPRLQLCVRTTGWLQRTEFSQRRTWNLHAELSPWLLKKQSGKYSGKSAEKKLLLSKWYPRLSDSVAHLRLFPLAFSPIGMGTETRYLIGPGAKLWKTGVSISSDVIGSAIGTGEIKKTHIHLLSLYIHII